MIKESREKEFLNKQAWGTKNEATKPTRTSWPTLRNPRVVRVSQTFGGKDRHSKVSTIRGLRDRRVRLSVPTAIQLYDLQHKLGLNQPSKVVDWLINASQHEIDKLPPLPLFQFPQYSSAVNEEITNENIAQTFVSDQIVFANNFVGQNGDEMDSATANNYDFFRQFDQPNLSQEEVGNNHNNFLLASGTQPMMASAFSLYGNNHNNFQMPTTFAQLLPLGSSRTSLQAGREQERKQ